MRKRRKTEIDRNIDALERAERGRQNAELSKKFYEESENVSKKLSFDFLKELFMHPRTDHPGRKR